MPLLEEWPPKANHATGHVEFYARLSARGLDYGPALQGLTGVWRLGETIYVEAALPADTISTPGSTAFIPRFLMLPCMCLREGFAADMRAACCFRLRGRM